MRQTRFFTKLLQLPHQQEILFGLCILFCAVSGILATYDAISYAEVSAGCSIIFFLLLHLNARLNPFIQKKLNKNYISVADVDYYVKAGQVMIGNGKNHYQGLSYNQRKKKRTRRPPNPISTAERVLFLPSEYARKTLYSPGANDNQAAHPPHREDAPDV